jgi:hypothetical protein
MAHTAKSLEELMESAMQHNAGFPEPLSADEVLKVVASAWGYEVEGKNHFGYGPRFVLPLDIINTLAAAEPRAFSLFSILWSHHSTAGQFVLAKAMAGTLGWSVNTMRDARDRLVDLGYLECVRAGGQRPNDPPIYRFGKGVKK